MWSVSARCTLEGYTNSTIFLCSKPCFCFLPCDILPRKQHHKLLYTQKIFVLTISSRLDSFLGCEKGRSYRHFCLQLFPHPINYSILFGAIASDHKNAYRNDNENRKTPRNTSFHKTICINQYFVVFSSVM